MAIVLSAFIFWAILLEQYLKSYDPQSHADIFYMLRWEQARRQANHSLYAFDRSWSSVLTL